jgi:tRNA A37 methylthiotransferase MiaB
MEKARRWSILNDILRESVQKRSERMIGRIESVLISGRDDDGNAFGRTRNWKEVYFPDERVHIGDIVPVLITH